MKTLTKCNWVQALEGNIDTAHISWLHQWDSIADLPDDGSDKPGYPSNAMSLKFWRHDRAPRIEVEDTWYGFKYAGVRTTPNGNTHVRVTAYAMPYFSMVAGIPFSGGLLGFVPIDDENCWGYFNAPRARQNPRGLGGPSVFSYTPFTSPATVEPNGIRQRPYNAENDYQVDRDLRNNGIFSGIWDFGSQDQMAVESQGPIRDRSIEHLGSTDRAVSRMRHMLLTAARALAEGREPPALSGDQDFGSIRGAEKVLEPDEDWRLLGTNADPSVQEALGLA
jgi:hypothetical protein